MRVPRLRLVFVWLAACLCHGQGLEQDFNVRVAMRDGVRLSTNVFRPHAGVKLPAVLVRTPYGKGTELSSAYLLFVENDYAVVIQDVRGRGASEGVFGSIDQEGPDGHDTIDWIAAQRWSDGKIAMLGGSYLGIVQWKAALTNNPYLKAISPAVSGSDDYEDRFYSKGGAMKLGHRLMWLSDNLRAPGLARQDFSKYVWHLPLRTADQAAAGRTIDLYQRALDHPAYDSFWKATSTREQLDKARVPVLAFGGWYDPFVENDLDTFVKLRGMGREARIVIGAWAHNTSSKFPDVDFGPDGNLPVRRMQLEWFDRWLKSKEPARPEAPVRVFLMGANRWRDEREWPPARMRPVASYLASGGRLQGTTAAGGKPDHFVYDPRKPVPTLGGALCCDATIFPWGPRDQRPVENRPDVLVYTGGVLGRDLEVLGTVRLLLYAATSAADTDFTGKLVDVYPDGRAINVADGILRLRYRESPERPKPAKPAEIYRLTIDMGVTGIVFRKGHRIRLEVSSSNFPHYDRNPNTGKLVAGETKVRPATQTIYHDAKHPSQLILPVTN